MLLCNIDCCMFNNNVHCALCGSSVVVKTIELLSAWM